MNARRQVNYPAPFRRRCTGGRAGFPAVAIRRPRKRDDRGRIAGNSGAEGHSRDGGRQRDGDRAGPRDSHCRPCRSEAEHDQRAEPRVTADTQRPAGLKTGFLIAVRPVPRRTPVIPRHWAAAIVKISTTWAFGRVRAPAFVCGAESSAFLRGHPASPWEYAIRERMTPPRSRPVLYDDATTVRTGVSAAPPRRGGGARNAGRLQACRMGPQRSMEFSLRSVRGRTPSRQRFCHIGLSPGVSDARA